MNGLRRVGAVGAASLVLWTREVARLLGTTTRAVRIGASLGVVVAVLFGLALAVVAGQQLTAEVPAELRSSLVRTSFAAAALTAGLVAVVLCVSAPARTALQNLLDLLPVSRAEARIGQLLPVLATGLLYGAALTSTSVVVIVRTSPGAGAIALGLLAYALLLVAVLLLTVGLFSLLQTAGRAGMRLPAPYASTFAGALSIAGVLAATAPDILALPSAGAPGWSPAELLPPRIFARAAVSFDAGSAAAAVVWMLLAALVLWAGSRQRGPEGTRAGTPLLRGSRPLARSPWFGRLWVELLVAVRNPQFLVTALLLPLGVAGVAALRQVPAAMLIVPALAGALPVLPFVLAVQSVGRTMAVHWVPALAAGPRAPWRWPKALAAATAGACLAVPVLIAVLATGLIPAAQLPDVLLRCLLGLVTALLCGAVVPYSEDQPLSATVGGFLLALLYMSSTLAIGWATRNAAPGTDRLLILAVAVVFAGLFAVVAGRLASREPGRA